jgi:hypothetical protein
MLLGRFAPAPSNAPAPCNTRSTQGLHPSSNILHHSCHQLQPEVISTNTYIGLYYEEGL